MADNISHLPKMAKDPSRFLASRIDSHAREDGLRTWASITKTNIVSDGFRDISYGELARAVDRASWWLDETFGQGNVKHFTYVGPKDLRFSVILVAAMKTGRAVFFPSAFLTKSASVHLLKVQKGENILVSVPAPKTPWLEGLVEEQTHLQMSRIPSFEDWFDDQTVDHRHYEWSPLWEDVTDEPVLILHTSGTTGMPKPVTYRNSTLVYFDALYQLSLAERSLGRRIAFDHYSGKRVWMPFPLGHLSGVFGFLLQPVYARVIPVLSPDVPLSADLSDQMMVHGNVCGAGIVPMLLDDIAARPDSLQKLSKLESVMWGTAPLSKKTAGLVSSKVRLEMGYAMSELPFHAYFKSESNEDWNYIHFHPSAGAEFRHHSDDLHELVIKRNDVYRDFQPVFTIFPDTDSFSTGDLFAPHPTKAGLWSCRGRIDDIISLSYGTTMHTRSTELAIEEEDGIRAALVGGDGKSAPYLLLELTQDAYNNDDSTAVNGSNNHSDEELVEKFWPSIEEVHDKLGFHDRVRFQKEQVIVAPADRPFSRLPKGSVDRKATVNEFSGEIEAAYENH